MKNHDIASNLERIGSLLELRDDNPFKARAYYQAAREIEGLPYQLDSPEKRDLLKTIPGIGVAIGLKILEMIDTGRSSYREELENEITPEVREMLRIPGLGPKRLRTIMDTLNVHSLGELEYACLENRIRNLKGFGEKSQSSILRGIDLVKRFRGFLLYPDAAELAGSLQRILLREDAIQDAIPAGGLRRLSETLNEIVFVVRLKTITENTKGSLAHSIGLSADMTETADTISGLLESGIRCTLVITDSRKFPVRLLEATGSAEHLQKLYSEADEKSISFRNGLMYREGEAIDAADEREIYQHIGLEYVPPELREGTVEIDLSRKRSIHRLIAPEDIRGCFHIHTSWSDGSNTIEEMARAAISRGMEYIGIADHSVSASYAGGLNEERVRQQWEEIDRLNRQIPGICIFKGVECDIRGDGAPDYDDALLAGFDYVIVSVHNRFQMDREEMTSRIIRAVSHPKVTMLGHPTGRLLLARDPYAVDMERVIEACAAHGTMIELNADPHRLDLDWRWHRYATDRGVLISINPDAHSTDGLDNIGYGINIARKGWLKPEDVFNTLTREQVAVKFSMMTAQRS